MTIDSLSVERIVIVRIGKIGDLIVSNFAIRKIRNTFPHATILLVTLPRNKELLRYSRDINRVRFFHKGADIVPLLAGVRLFRPDLLLDFNDNPSTTSALLARFSHAGTVVGFDFQKNRRFLTHPVDCPPMESSHVTERLRRIPEALGMTFKEEEIVPSMSLGERESEEVSRHLRNEERSGLIAVNLSAGHPGRYWKPIYWVQLLNAIVEREPHLRFLLLSAPEDRSLVRNLQGNLAGGKTILPAFDSFHHFAAYIAHSRMLISPDTSAIHIASAFQVAVLGLYPTVAWNHASWHPVGTLYETVRPADGLVGDIPPEAVFSHYLRLREKLL